MRPTILILAGLALAACDYLPGAAPAPDVTQRRGEFIAVVEAAGCRLDQAENEDVLVPAGFTDQEAGALGGLLVSEGLAEISDGDGDLILLTENCL
jgi:hypothetical protein